MGQEREGTSDKLGVGSAKDDGTATQDTTKADMPPTKHMPPVTIKEHATHGVVERRGCTAGTTHGAVGHRGLTHMAGGGQPGAEVCGQRKPSNDPRNNHCNLGTPTTGRR